MALADNGIFPAVSTDAINEKLAAIPGFLRMEPML